MSAFSDPARMKVLGLANQLGADSDTRQKWLDAPYPHDEVLVLEWCLEQTKGLQACIADAHAAWDDEANLMTKEDWMYHYVKLIKQAHKICDE